MSAEQFQNTEPTADSSEPLTDTASTDHRTIFTVMDVMRSLPAGSKAQRRLQYQAQMLSEPLPVEAEAPKAE